MRHAEQGSTVHLFIRENKGDPFVYAGPATYRSHEGEQPMRIRWELAHPLPADVLSYAMATPPGHEAGGPGPKRRTPSGDSELD